MNRNYGNNRPGSRDGGGYQGGGHGGGHRGGGHGGGQDGNGDSINAPYGFVPLAQLVEADWLRGVGDAGGDFVHDVPFVDGLTGTFEIVIEAETPICVAGAKTESGQPREMFRLPDKRYAIPATSLRGALRNVVEIASFGRMHLVNDHRYAVRDLHNRELYGDHMAGIQEVAGSRGKKEPMPLVNAGWLSRKRNEDDGKWQYFIEPCHFAKLEYGIIVDQARRQGANISLSDWGRKQSAPEKYKRWSPRPLNATLPVEPLRTRSTNDKKIDCDYGKVSDRGLPQEGVMVFTGQPQDFNPHRERRKGGGNPKHHDFFFYGKAGDAFEVPRKTFRDFEFAHADRGQQNRMDDSPNEEWKHWKAKLEKDEGARIPVFYLRETRSGGGRNVGDLRAIGLAMMFRLAYRRSIREAIENVQSGGALDGPVPDLAEAIFGTVRRLGDEEDRDAKTLTLKGRLLFSHAVEENGARPSDKAHTFVLGAPKASYYPNYVEQRNDDPGAAPATDRRTGKGLYKTWMDEDARPRGWKRYRPHEKAIEQIQYSNKVNLANVGTTFKPLSSGARFRSRAVVHNLRPMELGALIWALDFGGYSAGRHMLGLARPLGYGRSKLRIEKWEVEKLSGDPTTPEQLRDAFVAFMEERLGNTWASSWQIKELLALATPRPSSELRYQRLDADHRINEFIDAKKNGLSLRGARNGEGQAPRVPEPTGRSIPRQPTPGAPSGGSTSRTSAPPAPTLASSPVDDATRLGELTEPGNAADKVVEAKSRFEGNDAALKAFAKAALAKLPGKFRKTKADKPYMKWLEQLGND